MYAIFKAKGKQYRAEPDTTLRIPSLDAEPGDTVTFEEVLLGGADGEVVVGTPNLEGASVRAEVVRHGKDEKIVVFKMKRRKNYRRRQGHRQRFTEIRILGIELGAAPSKGRKPSSRARPKRAKPSAPPERREPAARADVEVSITDAARTLAEAHDLDLSEIEGSGKGGRILKSDVEKAIRAREA